MFNKDAELDDKFVYLKTLDEYLIFDVIQFAYYRYTWETVVDMDKLNLLLVSYPQMKSWCIEKRVGIPVSYGEFTTEIPGKRTKGISLTEYLYIVLDKNSIGFKYTMSDGKQLIIQ